MATITHDWRRVDGGGARGAKTREEKFSLWRCSRCGMEVRHYYDLESIMVAFQRAEGEAACPMTGRPTPIAGMEA
ncbi:protein of unknown function [Candidatus Hydrogenisulfobacillus filiaventi]|uniref:Uncharacterized protein n=1 Tax=Candidatus Hydrogenisulfobacillus filiaventi TaxID=2707344 RepID=A0A6F8ZIM9_9FIRM|nr:protein of unknown function [Candidatus Hydrogenisulfobacillus filiaventi]